MEIHPLLWQFVASLVAITVLYLLAKAMGLGAKPKLRSEEDVRLAADEVEAGFQTKRVSITRNGSAALAADDAGRIIVIKLHGNRFAGRVLNSATIAREVVDALIVDPGETGFGAVRLSIPDAPAWADAINRL